MTEQRERWEEIRSEVLEEACRTWPFAKDLGELACKRIAELEAERDAWKREAHEWARESGYGGELPVTPGEVAE